MEGEPLELLLEELLLELELLEEELELEDDDELEELLLAVPTVTASGELTTNSFAAEPITTL